MSASRIRLLERCVIRTSCPCTFTHDCYSIRITAECCYVLFDPEECHPLISQPNVCCSG